MVTLLKNSPIPTQPRELWLSEHINNNTTLQPSIKDGHVLTLTGARKGTTVDGVHFTGGATSNIVIAANAGQNAKAACNITIRFKLDTTFAAGAAGNFYLFNKVNAATYIRVYLKAVDGKLYWEQDNGIGGAGFSLTSTTVSWTANTWYIVTVSMTDVPVQRLLVNGTLEDNDVSAAVTTPNGGDIIIGSSSDGGTDGIVGTISWVVIGVGVTATVALTAANEADLALGLTPPTAKIQHLLLLDEGRGLTATDRGSLAVNGTLDSACTWFFGQVKAPILSLDGHNDYALSGLGLDLYGDKTFGVVVRMKRKPALTESNYRIIAECYTADELNYIMLSSVESDINIIRALFVVSGEASKTALYTTSLNIGDYVVVIITKTSGNVGNLYVNGTLAQSVTGVGVYPSATGYTVFGVLSNLAPSTECPDQILESFQLEGALSTAQVKTLTRNLRDKYNLPGSFA